MAKTNLLFCLMFRKIDQHFAYKKQYIENTKTIIQRALIKDS